MNAPLSRFSLSSPLLKRFPPSIQSLCVVIPLFSFSFRADCPRFRFFPPFLRLAACATPRPTGSAPTFLFKLVSVRRPLVPWRDIHFPCKGFNSIRRPFSGNVLSLYLICRRPWLILPPEMASEPLTPFGIGMGSFSFSATVTSTSSWRSCRLPFHFVSDSTLMNQRASFFQTWLEKYR